ncbi:hypothetical protein RAZWK3B_08506 [Roseobacter sp. AzwK-3b]|nr:hypothetical protein RAZWK3B_08506 [Roseobacter sp. AzwK-3b]
MLAERARHDLLWQMQQTAQNIRVAQHAQAVAVLGRHTAWFVNSKAFFVCSEGAHCLVGQAQMFGDSQKKPCGIADRRTCRATVTLQHLPQTPFHMSRLQ